MLFLCLNLQHKGQKGDGSLIHNLKRIGVAYSHQQNKKRKDRLK